MRYGAADAEECRLACMWTMWAVGGVAMRWTASDVHCRVPDVGGAGR
jgi:hypothetical protein